jgi:CRISPR-associated protein Cas2
MKRLWLISYDISDDKSRSRVHNTLKDYGKRVQYSVFECHLQDRELMDLRGCLLEIIATTDSLRWYPLCSWCQETVFFQGLGLAPEDEGFFLQ